MTGRRAARRRARDGRGQALVEFSLAITVFLFLVMATIDLGRAVYQQNAAAQAAREIARTTSVHPGGATLGSSTQTAATVAIQRRIVPGLLVDSYSCVDIQGTAVAGTCRPGNWVRVAVSLTFDPVMPFFAPFGPITLTSTSSAEIE